MRTCEMQERRRRETGTTDKSCRNREKRKKGGVRGKEGTCGNGRRRKKGRK